MKNGKLSNLKNITTLSILPFIIIGATSFIIVTFTLVWQIHLSGTLDAEASGTLVSTGYKNDKEHGATYTPTYSFVAKNGQTYECESALSSNDAPDKTHSIKYNSANPETCSAEQEGLIIAILSIVDVLILALFIILPIVVTHRDRTKIKKLEHNGNTTIVRKNQL